MLLGADPSVKSDALVPCNHPQVTFAYIKHLWKNNQKVKIDVQSSFNQNNLCSIVACDFF